MKTHWGIRAWINLIHAVPMTYYSWHGITMETHDFLTYEYLAHRYTCRRAFIYQYCI